jgi:ergothioneine biosynthesis protein EgtB
MDATSILDQYRKTRRFTAQLAKPLATEDYVVQAMPDCSPAKWHLAHTTWFFETFVLAPVPGYRRFDRTGAFERLFNSYYNSLGPQFPRLERGLLPRPTVAEVYAYRDHVDERLTAMLEAAESPGEKALETIRLGIHHEQQHQELILTDLKYLYSLIPAPLRPIYPCVAPQPMKSRAPAAWISFPEEIRCIGHSGARFAFDNETPRHRLLVPAFELASRPVTNAEYLDFMEDGGYDRPELWLSDGWQTVRQQGWRAPLYWEGSGGWRMMTLGGTRPVEPDEPVCHVSFFEADAYARWAGARLSSEAEWETAARDIPLHGNFAEQGHFHPVAATGGDAFEQMFGDAWEWTSSSYAAYPGYRPPPGALGEYNAKFMNGQYVLRGGSCFTPESHIRATYRNFFQPEKRWQATGIRLARDAGELQFVRK